MFHALLSKYFSTEFSAENMRNDYESAKMYTDIRVTVIVM